MDDQTLRIACTQVASSRSKEDNLQKIEKYARLAKRNGAEMVVFPEVFMCYFSPEDTLEQRSKQAESLSGKFVKTVREISRENGVSITVGIHESVEGSLKTYNTTVTTDENGEIINVYRKTHLYDAFNYTESAATQQSNNPLKVFRYGDFNVGVMVCYEVRFPEIARTLTLKGADIILIPSAWVKGYNKEDQWLTLVKARAIENTVYIATSNQIGNIYTGITSFVDPLGVILHRMNESEGYIVGEASRERLKTARHTLPLLTQRNKTLYET
ncbi:MAG: carbon-nitrogen hydrolase family protein [Thermoprotei archaeon]